MNERYVMFNHNQLRYIVTSSRRFMYPQYRSVAYRGDEKDFFQCFENEHNSVEN